MTYKETEFELVSLRQAQHECREHGATAVLLSGGNAEDELAIYDAGNGDYWGSVRVYGSNEVNARAVLAVLGY